MISFYFQKKKLNLLLGVVYKFHAGPISACYVRAIIKGFTFFSELPNIMIVSYKYYFNFLT